MKMYIMMTRQIRVKGFERLSRTLSMAVRDNAPKIAGVWVTF
jgi:hypothetical protein